MGVYAAPVIPWIIGATAVSAGTTLYAASKSAAAARENAELMNDAEYRRLVYNTEMWEMGREQAQLNYEQDVRAFEATKKNQLQMIAYQDKAAMQQYNYQLMINQYKQKALEQEYKKSEKLYGKRVAQNVRSEQVAVQQEFVKQRELQQEVAFENEELEIARIEAAGKLAAKGQSGRSAAKAYQTLVAKQGFNSAKLGETLASGARNMKYTLQEIALDRDAADLSALAQRMLKPGKLPDPLKPLPTPVPTFVGPRELTDADFGAQPILGTTYSPSAAASGAWATGIAGVGSAIAGGLKSYGATL